MRPCPTRKSDPGTRRRGAAVVEFAVVAPLLMLFVFGIIEFGRTMMVLNLLGNAAREGARVAALSGTTTTEIEGVVKGRLADEGVAGEAVTVRTLVNGAAADASTAGTGDTVTVRVRVGYDDVSYLPSPWFMEGATLRGQLAMRRE